MRVEVLLLIFALGGLNALLWGFGMVGDGVIIHDTHVANNVRPLIPKVLDKKVPLLPPFSGGSDSLTFPVNFNLISPP